MTPATHGVLSVDKIVAEAQAMHRRGGLDMVVVDYLQLIQPAAGSRRTERRDMDLGLISQALRAMATALKIPVIVTAQLNRSAADALPKASHLRESDTPAADADVILLLHDPRHTGEERPGELDIIVDKNRNGSCGVTVMVASLMHYQRLDNLAHVGAVGMAA